MFFLPIGGETSINPFIQPKIEPLETEASEVHEPLEQSPSDPSSSKRSRTVFTKEQIEPLEQEFQILKSHHVDK